MSSWHPTRGRNGRLDPGPDTPSSGELAGLDDGDGTPTCPHCERSVDVSPTNFFSGDPMSPMVRDGWLCEACGDEVPAEVIA